MSTDFFDYFFGFDKGFPSGNLGMSTYKHISKENEEILIVNAAGFKKENIKLETKTIGDVDYLYITGNPDDGVKDFVKPLNLRFSIKTNIIDSINGEIKDGLLYITVERKDNKSNIKINF